MTDLAVTLALGAARLLPAALGLGAVAGRAGWLAGAWLLALLPLVAPATQADAGVVTRLLLELALGAGFALALCGPLLAARHAGRMLELGFGATGSGSAPGALAGVFGWTFLALFAALGGLRLWSQALVEVPSLTLPDGSLLPLVLGAARFTTQLLRLSLVVAAPAWIAFVLLDVGMALVGRLSGGPGRAIVAVSLPLRLASVIVALPLAAERLPEWLRLAARAASRWAGQFAS